MSKKKIKISFEKLIVYISCALLFLCFLFVLALFFKFTFLNQKIEFEEIYFIAVIGSIGLLGSVLEFVLKKLIMNQIDKYLDKESLAKIVSQYIKNNEADINEKIQTIIDENEISRSEIKTKAGINISELNTVIVPVNNSWHTVKLNRVYECQPERFIPDSIKYIAFYYEKKIVGWSKIEAREIVNGRYKVSLENLTEISIPHLQKGAYVQNRRYCNIELLKKAINTDEIRPI